MNKAIHLNFSSPRNCCLEVLAYSLSFSTVPSQDRDCSSFRSTVVLQVLPPFQGAWCSAVRVSAFCSDQGVNNFCAKRLSGRQTCFLPSVSHVKESNGLLTPTEQFPRWILWFGFLSPSPREPCSYLSGIAPARIRTISNPLIPLPVLQVRNSSNQIYLLLSFSKYNFADSFTRYSFNALLASICRLLFVQALPQYTMYEMHLQVTVQFAFQVLNRTVNVLVYLLHFKHLLTIETVTYFQWLSGSKRAYFFILQTTKENKS